VGVLVLVSRVVDNLGASFPRKNIGRVVELPLPCHRAWHS
jgi:hypothetical protein